MKSWIRVTVAVLVATAPFCFVAANGQEATTLKAAAAQVVEPQTYRMEIVWIAYAQPREWVIVIERSGFKSIDDLKKGVSTLPKGSILELKTGGRRSPNEPLSSEKDMTDFKKFCESKNVELVLIPGR